MFTLGSSKVSIEQTRHDMNAESFNLQSSQQKQPTANSTITAYADPKSGEFQRRPSSFREHISSDPSSRFPAATDRYHLYVSYACPWAHRALIVRKLKGLQEFIPVTVVHWEMLEKGWRFIKPEEAERGEVSGVAGKEVEQQNVSWKPCEGHESFGHLREIYFSVDKDYSGRFTVPTLWDKKEKTIVNNEVYTLRTDSLLQLLRGV